MLIACSVYYICWNQEIEKHAGEHDLFRKSGGEKAVKRLMRKINEDCNYSDYASVSKHDLVGLFKRFINNLAEPLIPWNQVEFWLQVASMYPNIVFQLWLILSYADMTKGKEDAARLLMLLLPTNRRLVCKRLFECLFEIYTANVTAVARSPKGLNTFNTYDITNLSIRGHKATGLWWSSHLYWSKVCFQTMSTCHLNL